MPERVDADRAIGALLACARPLLLAHFRPDCCIAATRVGIAALRRCGVAAEPVPLNAAIFNAAAAALLAGGLDPAALPARCGPPDAPGGPWSVGLGRGGPAPGRWAGHLAIGVGRRTLVDLSLDQASRPHKGLALRPAAFPIADPAWWAGRAGSVAAFERDGAVVILRPDRRNTAYRGAPDWRGREALFRALAGAVAGAMRDRLAGPPWRGAAGGGAG